MPTDWQSIGGRIASLHKALCLDRWLRPPHPKALLLDQGTWFYLLSLIAEVPALLVRFMIALIVEVVVFTILGWSPSSNAAGDLLNVAALPTAWSVLGLLGVWGGGAWWRASMGGRTPSQREALLYEEAMRTLQARSAEPLVQPSSWFVYDVAQPDACVCGSSLALSRGLFSGPFLEAVLAHELGHLRSSDGRLTAALNRLVLFKGRQEWETAEEAPEEVVVVGEEPLSHRAGYASGRVADHVFAVGYEGEIFVERFVRFVWFLVRMAFRVARGGVAMRVIGSAWAAHWRSREYAADAFAVSLGQGEDLAIFLEGYALPNDRPVPFIWMSEKSHPPSELRIDRIAQEIARRRAAGLEADADEADVVGVDPVEVEGFVDDGDAFAEPSNGPEKAAAEAESAGAAQAQVAQEPEPVKRGQRRNYRSRSLVAALDRTRPLRSRRRSGPGRGPARSADRAHRR